MGGETARGSGDPVPVAGDTVWTERERALMGTVLRVRVAASDRNAGFRAAEEAFAAVERVEEWISTWSPDTELSRLNRAPPRKAVDISAGLGALLRELRSWTRSTGGAFDPTVGALVDAWDLRGAGRRPDSASLEEAREAVGWRHFEIEASGSAVRRLHPGAWIDAGGFGKGLALARARRALRRAGIGSALLDFGGQVVAFGSPPDGGDCWTVGVAHPRHRERGVAELSLCGGSAATTSAGERFVTAGGDRYGHVLDPRTGRPVPAWGSATVVCEEPMAADLLSTALFVMGPDAGRSWARSHGVAALLLERTGDGSLRRVSAPALEAGPGGGSCAVRGQD